MVDVPTREEFTALEARVAALEQTPTDPTDPPPQPATGAQARRIAGLVGLFGVNTFSSMDDGNVWGSWPSDYRPESVAAALDYMTANTGHSFRVREYHYAGREDMQRKWLTALPPKTRVSLCIGANGSVADVASMVMLADDPACGVAWVEGLNEPNTDFGSGMVPVETTLAIQQAVAALDKLPTLGPSIVAGTPHPEGWITGYCGDSLAAMTAAMERANGHYYPPGCPTLPGTGHSVVEYVSGLQIAYGAFPTDLTEFHPTLYSSENNGPGMPGWSGERDAYYSFLTLLACGEMDVGLFWYALFDYGETYTCGLFPRAGTDEPRPTATALRNLCTIAADTGQDAATFPPGKLDFEITGMPTDGGWSLYQASDQRFFIILWRSATEPGGASTGIIVHFGSQVRHVTEYDPLVSLSVKNSMAHADSYGLALDAGVRILVVEH